MAGASPDLGGVRGEMNVSALVYLNSSGWARDSAALNPVQ